MSEGFKKCPFCNRVILGNATECKHCGANLAGGGSTTGETGSTNHTVSGDEDFGFFEGLTYMFTDKNLFMKWAGLAIVCMLIVIPYISMLGSMTISSDASAAQQINQIKNSFMNMLFMLLPAGIFYGHMINCIRDITTSSGTYNLPAIKFIDDFWTGVKFYLAMLLLMIPVALVTIVLGIIFTIMKPLVILIPLLNIAFSLFMMVFTPAFMWIFAQTKDWTTFYKWNFIKRVMATGNNRYIKALLIMFLCGLIMWIPFCITFAVLIFALKANVFVLTVAYSIFGAYGTYFGAFYIAKSISADQIKYLP